MYHLKPDSNELHILDFNTQKFRVEQLSQKVPFHAKSYQTITGDIYVVGGFMRNESSSENQVLKDCFKIDRNMQVTR